MKQRTVIALILICVMLLSSTVVALADTTPVSAAMTRSGDSVTLTVDLAENSNATNGEVQVSYDTTKLSLVSAMGSELWELEDINTDYQTAGDTKTVSAMFVSSEKVTAGGTILTLAFEALTEDDVSADVRVELYSDGQSLQDETIPVTAETASEELSDLDRAVNVEGGTIHFTASEQYPMEVTEKDGQQVAGSTNKEMHSTSSGMSTTLDLVSGNALKFQWNIDCEARWDELVFTVNGAEEAALTSATSGVETGWQTYIFIAEEAGSYTFEWSYTKDRSGTYGEDTAWVDNVELIDHVDTYTVTFKTDGNGTLSGETMLTVIGGSSLSSAQVPTVTANSGYKFSTWTNEAGETVQPVGTVINEDTTFIATFEELAHYTLTFTTDGGGNFDGEPTVVIDVVENTVLTSDLVPTVSANYGYEFIEWSPRITYWQRITSDLTFTATFRQLNLDGEATIILRAPEVWGDHSGYQMVLDADHNTYGTIISSSGYYFVKGQDADFSEFEYTVPEGADGRLDSDLFVCNGEAGINIPAGYYDFAVLNIDADNENGEGSFMYASGSYTRGDDMVFEAGKTYIFEIALQGSYDNVHLTIEEGNQPLPTGDPNPEPEEEPIPDDHLLEGYEVVFREGFNWSIMPAGWTQLDKDEYVYTSPYSDPRYFDWEAWYKPISGTSMTTHHGNGLTYSNAYVNYIGEVNPDNWLITPELEVKEGYKLSFSIAEAMQSTDDENYTGPMFDPLDLYVSVAGGEFVKIGTYTAYNAWETFIIDVSEYAGSAVRFAFAHTVNPVEANHGILCLDCVYLYAPIEYTVTFVADGETVATVVKGYNEELTEADYPEVPAKPGYTGSWTPFVTGVLTEDITIEAVYTPIPYTVTFTADGTVVDTVTKYYGDVLTEEDYPEVPAKEGYTGEWPVVTAPITGDLTIEAVYTLNTYTVTFTADGAVVGTVTKNHGDVLAEEDYPELPVKEGHTGEWPVVTAPITGNLTIEAVYTPIPYTVTFKADGVVVATITKNYGEVLAEKDYPEIPAKEGYTGKWPAVTAPITGDLTIEAVYTLSTYTVTFTADGTVVGTVIKNHGEALTEEDYPELPAKEGCTGEWPVVTAPITGDLTIEAVYTLNTYTVTFEADGTVVATIVKNYGDVLTEADYPAVPAKEGYTGEWTKVTEPISGNIVITAVYTAEPAGPDDNAKTGDSAMIVPMIVLMFLSATAIVTLEISRKKRV